MSASFYLFFPTSFGVCVCECVHAVSVCSHSKRTHKFLLSKPSKEVDWLWLIFSVFHLKFIYRRIYGPRWPFRFLLQMHFFFFGFGSMAIERCFSLFLEQQALETRRWPNFPKMRPNQFYYYYLLRVTNIIKINCFFIWDEVPRDNSREMAYESFGTLIKSFNGWNGGEKTNSQNLICNKFRENCRPILISST